jgi:predicted HTH domain antitoxin
MGTVILELPPELLDLLGSETAVRLEAKVALVLDLVRQGRISRAKAAELLDISLWDLPALLARYRIPWFDYSAEDMERDLQSLRTREDRAG